MIYLTILEIDLKFLGMKDENPDMLTISLNPPYPGYLYQK
jgi:hypothetical protein